MNHYPRAILHVDGDAFFASCEVASRPWLRGKPVVTGLERGIASAMTYEAKARGVVRGMRISDIRRVCPDAVVLPSDYDTYALYAARMYRIVGRYAREVEPYSIDECFADITGMNERLGMSYPDIAASIKRELYECLGITFSVGLSVNKVLSKVASKHRKPDGLTCIPADNIPAYTRALPLGKVWGIGSASTILLGKLGLSTAFDLAEMDRTRAVEHLVLPLRILREELGGVSVMALNVSAGHGAGGEARDIQSSIQRTRTFRPPSSVREVVWSELARNAEEACASLRSRGLRASRVSFFLKTQEFEYDGAEVVLRSPSAAPEALLAAIAPTFSRLFNASLVYRATGIRCMGLVPLGLSTPDLFGTSDSVDSVEEIHRAIDRIGRKHGAGTVHLAAADKAMRRQSAYPRQQKKFAIPFLGKTGPR